MDYEVRIAALLSLRCLERDIKDMWLMINVEGCGEFDDIILRRKTKTGKGISYLIQIRHQESPKDITPQEFLKTKGAFCLARYIGSIVQMQKIKEGKRYGSKLMRHLWRSGDELNFVLFTNRRASGNNCLKNVEETSHLQFINTNNGDIQAFDFEKLGMSLNSDRKELLNKLYLFSNQFSRKNLDAKIIKEITKVLPLKLPQKALNALCKKFVWFISDWSKGYVGGHYPLTKIAIIRKLMELLLEPYMVQLEKTENNNSFNRPIWRNIISENRVIFVDADDVVIKFLYHYINGEIVESRQSGISCEEYHYSIEYDLLWKTGKLPLLLEVYSSDSAKRVIRVLEQFQTFAHVKVIILNKSSKSLTGLQLKKQTLDDLSEGLQGAILGHTVRLQGKPVRLKSIITKDMFHLLTFKEIIYILLGVFNIGRELPILPEFFVRKSLPAILLQAEVLEKVSDEVFVVHCAFGDDFQSFLKTNAVNVDCFNTYAYEDFKKNYKIFCFVRLKTFIKWDDLEHIDTHIKSQTVHHLLLNNFELEWIRSKGSTKSLRPYRKEKIAPSDINAAEKLLHRSCKKSLKPILISAGPGMGKSTLVNFLARQTSPWTILARLHEHRSYFSSEDFKIALLNPKNFLIHFGDISAEKCCFARAVFGRYLDSEKIWILFDGFDEVSISHKEEVTKTIQGLLEAGYPVLVTTRPVMKIHLETTFDTLSYTLDTFGDTFKKKFLTKAFASNTSREKDLLETLAGKILAKVDSNPWIRNIAGDPLQLTLLSELSFSDCEKVSENFDLILLFENYTQKEFQIDDKFAGDFLCFSALERVFSRNVLVQADVYKGQNDAMLSKTARFPGDRIFAEYFAAKWLSQNTDSKKLVKETFDPHHSVMRRIFDQILAKTHRLHLAIINNQLDAALALTRSQNVLYDVDEGGRTFLHLAAAWGVHHPSTPSEEEINTLRQSILEEIPSIFDTVHINRINSKDELLNYTPLEYALASGSLNIANAICQKLQYFNFSFEISVSSVDAKNAFLYIKVFQYDSLKSVLNKHFNRMKRTTATLYRDVAVEHESEVLEKLCLLDSDEGYLTMHSSPQPLSLSLTSATRSRKPIEVEDANFLLGAAQKGYTDIMYSLVSKGANLKFRDKTYGKTALILAAERGHVEAVTLLLSKGADVEAADNEGMTPLHWASYCGHTNIVNLLLARGADVEVKDGDEMTPLQWAAYKGQPEVVNLLLLKNAARGNKNVNGLTALDLAKNKGNENIVTLLKEK